MSDGARLDLAAEHRARVVALLRAHLPPATRVWVFGSRATGRAGRWSDLDLAVDAGRRLSLDEQAALAEAFSESDLPFTVDVVDWQAAGDRFRQTIAADRLALDGDPPPGAAGPPITPQ